MGGANPTRVGARRKPPQPSSLISDNVRKEMGSAFPVPADRSGKACWNHASRRRAAIAGQ